MIDRTVAESYAQEHCLAFVRAETLRFGPRWPPGSQRCVNAMHSLISDGPSGRHAEVITPDAALMAWYRVSVASEGDKQVAGGLLNGDFAVWLTGRAREFRRFDFEVWQRVLFICGPIDAFKNRNKLDAFARASARIAAQVATLAKGRYR